MGLNNPVEKRVHLHSLTITKPKLSHPSITEVTTALKFRVKSTFFTFLWAVEEFELPTHVIPKIFVERSDIAPGPWNNGNEMTLCNHKKVIYF